LRNQFQRERKTVRAFCLPSPKDVKIDPDKSSAYTRTPPLPQEQTGSAAALPYLETAGLT